jgi:hypothetical protein
MPVTNQTPFTFDPVLTAVANVEPSQEFINDQVLPTFRVGSSAFAYLYVPRGERMTLPETIIGNRGLPNEVVFHMDKRTGETQGHALKTVVPNRVKDEGARVDYYDPRASAVSGVRELLELGTEKSMAETVFTAANYPTDHVESLGANDQFSNPDSDPARMILMLMDDLPYRPNIAVVGQRVATALRLHPKIVKAYNRNEGGEGVVTLDFVASYLGLQRILIGTAKYNTAPLGQDLTIGELWGNKMALLHSSNRPLYDGAGRVFALSFGATFYFPINGQRYATFTWNNAEPGVSGVEEIKVSTEYVHKVLVPDAGFLFTDVVG